MKGQRSRSYPVLDLREASATQRRVVRTLGQGAHEKDRVAQAIGYTNGSTGAAARKLSALVQFGFLKRRKGKLSPTPLAERALSNDPRVRQAALKEAFLEPPLFEEIWERYGPEGRVPQIFPDILVSDYRISEAAKHSVARIFMDCAHYAELLADDGCTLRWSSGSQEKPQMAELRHGYRSVEVGEHSAERPPHEVGTRDIARPEPEVNASERQSMRLKLSEGMADISLPEQLSKQDVSLLRSWLDLLDQQVDAHRLAVVEPFRRPRSSAR